MVETDENTILVQLSFEWGSSMRSGDVTALTAFMTIADVGSFSEAASRLEVTPSALSHTMRHLEERLAIRLLNWTTRSVSVTDDGLRLLRRLRPAMEQIGDALEDLNAERERPHGRLRVQVLPAAVAVITSVMDRFLSTYPEVELEVRVAEMPVELVTHGWDATIGVLRHATPNMIAVRVCGPLKIAVAAAPSYFANQPRPLTPDDLARHQCVQFRMPSGEILQWGFERCGKTKQIRVSGRITVNDPDLAIRAAVDGLGIVYTIQPLIEPYLRSGQLVRVLEGWSPSHEGMFLFHSSRRQVPAALRAFIDMVRGTSERQAKTITSKTT